MGRRKRIFVWGNVSLFFNSIGAFHASLRGDATWVCICGAEILIVASVLAFVMRRPEA